MPYNSGVSAGFYRPYLQPTPGLGSYQRTSEAIILGGPRAGAGSGSRIYNYLSARNQLYPTKVKIQELFKSRQYQLASTYRNYLMSAY